MSTLHATCASHTHAQTSCSKRVLCPPPRQLRPSTPSHDTRDREPQAQKEKRPYVPPARRRASPPLVSFSTRPAPAHPFMSAVIIPSLCMHPARASEGSDTTPHHNPHSTMTARFTQHKTRELDTAHTGARVRAHTSAECPRHGTGGNQNFHRLLGQQSLLCIVYIDHRPEFRAPIFELPCSGRAR